MCHRVRSRTRSLAFSPRFMRPVPATNGPGTHRYKPSNSQAEQLATIEPSGTISITEPVRPWPSRRPSPTPRRRAPSPRIGTAGPQRGCGRIGITDNRNERVLRDHGQPPDPVLGPSWRALGRRRRMRAIESMNGPDSSTPSGSFAAGRWRSIANANASRRLDPTPPRFRTHPSTADATCSSRRTPGHPHVARIRR